MMPRSSLAQPILSADLKIQSLISNAQLVGGIYTMGYDECLVLTNDIWKRAAGGIPQHGFLLAASIAPGEVPDPEDEEVILLRVIGPAALPAESELVSIRAEAMREIVTARGRDAAASTPAIVDVLTRNEIQFSALRAKVLGTFYDAEVNGNSLLSFGSDIETFYSSSRYKVYKPFGPSLGIVASYPGVTRDEELARQQTGLIPSRVRIGEIRYTSTERRRSDRLGEASTAVPVQVNIEDFVALKTAVFGMTRLGKSNTMKTLATAIFELSVRTDRRIGQLLFDPAGEYANVNVQDETALSQIGDNYVTIFRFGAAGHEAGVRPLSTNFYSDQTIEVAWSIISSYLHARKTADYIQRFLSANVIGPEREDDDRSEWNRARRRRAALYATLVKAGFETPENFRATFAANKDVVTAVNAALGATSQATVQSNRKGLLELDRTELLNWFEALRNATLPATQADWVDTQMEAILNVLWGGVGSGFRLLEPLRVYHSTARQDDYAKEVLKELVDGKIVIIDLSRGSETVLRFISERIINYIVQDAAQRFANGAEPHSIQIYIEEAHRLFNRDRMSAPAEADPYVRLAKEAAKFKIGLIYATQEVTSVDPIVLSNTSNWIVTHLNNHLEVKELSKYYDFQDFAELTLKAEDVGFVRLKTKSGRYIIPCQIDLFSADRIESARLAALEHRRS